MGAIILKQLLRIQIVDDFQPWIRLLETIVENAQLGQVICTASDGYVALRKAEELKPDLILLDINIPTINGIELARALQPCQFRPLILFVSHYETPSIVRAAIEAGGNGFVLKTHIRQDLEQAILAIRNGERFLSEKLQPHFDS